MGQRGPKPETNISLVPPLKKRWPNPAPGMTKNARTTWHRICHSYPAGHFKPHQYDLLRVYCEASASHRKAILEMKKDGQVITQSNGVTKKNPWKDIEVQMANVMGAMSTKLGLSANSTMAAKGIKGNDVKPKSKRSGLIFNG